LSMLQAWRTRPHKAWRIPHFISTKNSENTSHEPLLRVAEPFALTLLVMKPFGAANSGYTRQSLAPDSAESDRGLSPRNALALGLKVDQDAIPSVLITELKQGRLNLDDPAVTLELLRLNAVVGLTGFCDSQGELRSVGIQCALCHSIGLTTPNGKNRTLVRREIDKE
jgi:hypothetical protein